MAYETKFFLEFSTKIPFWYYYFGNNFRSRHNISIPFFVHLTFDCIIFDYRKSDFQYPNSKFSNMKICKTLKPAFWNNFFNIQNHIRNNSSKSCYAISITVLYSKWRPNRVHAVDDMYVKMSYNVAECVYYTYINDRPSRPSCS